MDKALVQVAIPRDLLDDAIERGCDLDSEVESALRRRLNRPCPNIAAAKAEIDRACEQINELVERYGSFGEEWRTF